jgi:transposase
MKQILAPQLRPGDILIMDNLMAHKSSLALEVVQSHHADIKFLPAYSPDFNPIEKILNPVDIYKIKVKML